MTCLFLLHSVSFSCGLSTRPPHEFPPFSPLCGALASTYNLSVRRYCPFHRLSASSKALSRLSHIKISLILCHVRLERRWLLSDPSLHASWANFILQIPLSFSLPLQPPCTCTTYLRPILASYALRAVVFSISTYPAHSLRFCVECFVTLS